MKDLQFDCCPTPLFISIEPISSIFQELLNVHNSSICGDSIGPNSGIFQELLTVHNSSICDDTKTPTVSLKYIIFDKLHNKNMHRHCFL